MANIIYRLHIYMKIKGYQLNNSAKLFLTFLLCDNFY